MIVAKKMLFLERFFLKFHAVGTPQIWANFQNLTFC